MTQMTTIRFMAALAFASVSLFAAAGDEPGFKTLFDGKTLAGWTLQGGHGPGYVVEDGSWYARPTAGQSFYGEGVREFRFSFRVPDGGWCE